MPMRDIIKDEPLKVETIEQADAKFQAWDTRIFGDRRNEELHAQSIAGQLETVKRTVQIVTDFRAKFNQALTWVLAAAFGALGLWAIQPADDGRLRMRDLIARRNFVLFGLLILGFFLTAALQVTAHALPFAPFSGQLLHRRTA